MKIVVTGCLGFIGSHFVQYTLNKYPDIEIIGFDRNTDTRQHERIASVKGQENFRLVLGDLTGDISEAFHGAEMIFNFGAKSFVDHSIYSPKSFIDSNIFGVFNILEFIRHEKDNVLLIQVGTDEVYGPLVGDEPFTEETKLNPTNPYSATKACGDLLCETYRLTYGLDILVTRCENNFGEYQHPQKALPVFIKCALEGKNIPMYSPGTQKRKWLYVKDHCDAIWTLVNTGAKGVHNIAGGVELENLELAYKVLRFLEVPYYHDKIEMIDTSTIRPFHDKRYHIKAEVLEGLKWKPLHNLDEALDQTIRWYKKNRRWLVI